jgi:hypothetical protein
MASSAPAHARRQNSRLAVATFAFCSSVSGTRRLSGCGVSWVTRVVGASPARPKGSGSTHRSRAPRRRGCRGSAPDRAQCACSVIGVGVVPNRDEGRCGHPLNLLDGRAAHAPHRSAVALRCRGQLGGQLSASEPTRTDLKWGSRIWLCAVHIGFDLDVWPACEASALPLSYAPGRLED